MKPVDLTLLAGDPEPVAVTFAKDQPEYQQLPALRWKDGKVLTEWELTEEERGRLVAGERLRLFVWVYPTTCAACGHVQAGLLQPVALQVTSEDVS